MKKDVRREKILDLINEKPISTQLELLQALADAGLRQPKQPFREILKKCT